MTCAPRLFAFLLVFGAIAAALAGLFLAAGPTLPALPWPYIAGVVRFTLFQAALSTILSLVLGAALALALARRARFTGRGLFVAALNLASVLPGIVAVFGIVAVLGRSGWLSDGLRVAGFDPGAWLYGLPGILVAHVFFNAPLAARIFLAALNAVPGEHWRLAAQLGMRPFALFRLIDLPLLKRETPGIATLIFLLCFTSFAVVLALGGGPSSATLEVAIYSAVRFDADFARAGILALLQVAICLILASPLIWLGRRTGEAASLGVVLERPDADDPGLRRIDRLVLTAGALLVLPPLASILIYGVAGAASLASADVLTALGTSMAIAVPSAAIAVGLALAFARGREAGSKNLAGNALTAAPGLILAVPPIAISAGLFVILRRFVDPFALAIPVIVAINALMALPFALRQVEPALLLSAERTGRLAGSLGMTALSRLRLVDWPLLRAPLLSAYAVALALSLGDLGASAFFGSGAVLTLPLLLYQRLGSYRTDEAASVALLLAALVLTLFLVAQKLSGDALARSR